MKELSVEILKTAIKQATKKSVRLNKALGLKTLSIKNDKLILEDNNELSIIGSPEFGLRKADKKSFKLNNGH